MAIQVNNKSVLIWLDDMRNPFQDNWIKDYAPDFINETIVWVKNYTEFTTWIEKNGLPDMIAFDHDLGEDESRSRVESGMSKRKSRSIKRETKSGMECTKFLVEYCMDRNLPAPNFVVQSANPVGKQNITSYIENYNKHYGR